jgi:histidinol-phosphatase (PHP family)
MGLKTMGYKNLMDLHMHTDNSFDGHAPATLLCEKAVEKGLRAIAFTDHVEMDLYREEHFDRTAKQSYFQAVQARSAFRGVLVVCAGVEMGEATYNLPESEALISSYHYDIVLGSIHNLRGMQDFWFLPYSEYSDEKIAELLREYFEELRLLAVWGKFDVLTHLTYPLRYIVGEHHRNVDITDYYGQIDTVLQAVIANNLALEINTSGLRQPLGLTMPDEPILRRYKALGGEKISFGSDAHYTDHVGAGLTIGMDLALRCGFTRCCLFGERECVELPIV